MSNPPETSATGAGVPSGHEIERASGGQSNADKAADTAPRSRDDGEDPRQRQEEILDEAIEETFPASDPIAPKQITR